MWKCHKCGKPVYFAERKQSLGYDWHPECLRCEECGKRLNPGQHAEHKGVPYCHVPCYGALFGPQLFGHGTRVESHKSFGQQKESSKNNGPLLLRNHIESKLKAYNQYFDGKSGEIRCREVNGRLVLEGSLRIHWGVQGVIHLKENDDQRTVVTVRKRNSRISSEYDSDEDIQDITTDSSCYNLSLSSDVMLSSTDTLSPDEKLEECVAPLATVSNSDERNHQENESDAINSQQFPQNGSSERQSQTLPVKLDIKNVEWDELDDLLQVERKVDDSDKLYRTMPAPLVTQSSVENSTSTDSSSTEKADLEVSTITEQTLTINGNTSAENGDAYEYENGTISRTDTQTPTQTESDTKATMETSWSESNHLNRSMSGPDCLERMRNHSPEFDRSSASFTSCDTTCRDTDDSEVVVRRAAKTGSTAIKRRPGKRLSRSKIKRRCSINGHFYDRETSFFTPPHGSQMSVWVTSLVNTQEVINLLLEKYKVESYSNNFALFAVRDNGEQRKLKAEEPPLLTRVLLGPHEDVVRLFLMDSNNTPEVSSEVAQFLNLTLAECRGILNQYYTQEEREIAKIREKHAELKWRIKSRMEELKVRL